MKSLPGSYVLLLRSQSTAQVQVGRWGLLSIEPGCYLYVGSAFGPGGVRARVLRHCRESKSKHWHIDYLREFVTPVGAWLSYDSKHLEHQWADTISCIVDMSAIKGFGCTDCQCDSHLFLTRKKPNFETFTSLLDGEIEWWVY